MNDTPTILADGSPYTGVLWSNDERTMSIEVRNGVIETFTFYHMNGKIANIQYGSNFDEEGYSLEEWELDNKYPYLRDATERIMKKGDYSKHR